MNTIEITRYYHEHPEAARDANEQFQKLLVRSATDREFRSRLLTDWRTTLAEFAGRPMPESVNITFIENKADATIVLPDPIDPAAALSEADLEAVAGGTGALCIMGAIAGGVLVGQLIGQAWHTFTH